MKDQLGCADYLATLQRLRTELDDDQPLLAISAFVLDYPFEQLLYPRALDVIVHLGTLGLPVVLSDGDVVLQPRKIHRAGIWSAVGGRVLVTLHKERELDAMQRRYPASRYVTIDDKPELLAAMKDRLGARLTTVFVRQGHYAAESTGRAVVPPPDHAVDRIGDLLDLAAIRGAGIRMGVDPLGGAGVHYWARIAEHHRLDLTVVSEQVDPTFGFMTVDWDGQIRMDPSLPYAMQRLIGLKDRYDIAFACDTDHDRHGIVCRGSGLLPSNHYLTAASDHLLRHRSGWRADAVVGKTVVTSAMIDRVAARLGRRLHEVPVGFKWFVDGLFDGSLAFGGEESAGASFLRRDGTVWTTDKDGIVAALLSAEIYGESFRGEDHLHVLLGEAQRLVDRALGDAKA